MNLVSLRPLARVSFYILLGLVFYLTVKPNPAIQEIRWMPEGATVFFDLYDGWKNAVGYGMLALAAFLGWPEGWGGSKWTLIARTVVQIGACCGIIVGMEAIQLTIPTRFFDVKDITAGSFGVLVAYGVALTAEWCGRVFLGWQKLQRYKT